MREKLRDSSGLTLLETLCTAAILLLLCLIVSAGIHTALVSYRALTSEAEVQLLLSSLSDALADKLRYCVVYTDETGTAVTGCSVGDFTAEPDGVVRVGGSKLLPDGVYGEEITGGGRKYRAETLEVTPSPDGGTASFTVKLKVKEAAGDIGAETELTVRCLNPTKVKEEETPP